MEHKPNGSKQASLTDTQGFSQVETVEDARQMLGNLRRNSTKTSGQDRETVSHNDKLIHKVFGGMRIAWPSQYEKYYGEGKEKERQASKRMWLGDDGFSRLTEQQIAIGLKNMVGKSKWMPSLAEFVEHCKPVAEDFGMPSPEDAYREASSNSAYPSNKANWSHEAVRVAGNMTSWWDMSHADNDARINDIKKRYIRNYETLVNQVMNGQEIVSNLIEKKPEPPMSDKQKASNKQTGLSALAELRSRLK